jgi:hypothetical protein
MSAGLYALLAVGTGLGTYALYRRNQKQAAAATRGFFGRVGLEHQAVDYQNPADCVTDNRPERDELVRPYQIYCPGGETRPYEIDAHGQPTGRQLVMPGESPTVGSPADYVLVAGPSDCGPDSYWDPTSQQCVSVALPTPSVGPLPSCPPGSFYDYLRATCVPAHPTQTSGPADCGPDSYWDPASGQCIPVALPSPSVGPVPSCPPGQFYDYLRQTCVPSHLTHTGAHGGAIHGGHGGGFEHFGHFGYGAPWGGGGEVVIEEEDPSFYGEPPPELVDPSLVMAGVHPSPMGLAVLRRMQMQRQMQQRMQQQMMQQQMQQQAQQQALQQQMLQQQLAQQQQALADAQQAAQDAALQAQTAAATTEAATAATTAAATDPTLAATLPAATMGMWGGY